MTEKKPWERGPFDAVWSNDVMAPQYGDAYEYLSAEDANAMVHEIKRLQDERAEAVAFAGQFAISFQTPAAKISITKLIEMCDKIKTDAELGRLVRRMPEFLATGNGPSINLAFYQLPEGYDPQYHDTGWIVSVDNGKDTDVWLADNDRGHDTPEAALKAALESIND